MRNHQPTNRLILAFVQLLVVLANPVIALDLNPKKAERDAAIGKIPWQKLTPEARRRVEQIIDRPTMFRRLPAQGMDCDQDMFLFLVRHPEVLVGIWEVMDITQVRMTRTGPYVLTAKDGQGTTCVIELVYGDASTHLYVARGMYDGNMVTKPITGSGVFVLHSSYSDNSTGRVTTGSQMDVFLQLDSKGADLVVRTLGPLIGRSADHNFVETAKFIAQVSEASEVNPEGVKRLGLKLPQVTEPIRNQFIEMAQAVANRNDVSSPPLALDTSPLGKRLSAQIMMPSSETASSVANSDNPVQPRKSSLTLRR